MGLDLLPRPCPCGLHGWVKPVPKGRMHDAATECPLLAEKFRRAPWTTCCSLRGKIAAQDLAALGEADVAERMYDEMSAEEALAFARTLRRAADRIEERYQDVDPKPLGAAHTLMLNEATGEAYDDNYSSFTGALAAICEAARWYARVGTLGFGVASWY